MDVIGYTSENNSMLNAFTSYVLSLFEEVDTEAIYINDSVFETRHIELNVITFSDYSHFNLILNHQNINKNKPFLLIHASSENHVFDFEKAEKEITKKGAVVWGNYTISDIKNNFSPFEGILNIKLRLTLIRIINDIIYNKMKRNINSTSCGIKRESREYGDESDY